MAAGWARQTVWVAWGLERQRDQQEQGQVEQWTLLPRQL